MRIWFNHWFSTAYRMIELLKNNSDAESMTIIGSSMTVNSVYKTVCDEFYVEHLSETSEDYSEWCLNFCKIHNIDVFYPYHGRLQIAKNLSRFTEIGVTVIVEPQYDLLLTLEDKVKTAQLFKEQNICEVAPYFYVNTLQEFDVAYSKLTSMLDSDDVICVKYAKDVGAQSFRVIDKMPISISTLTYDVGHKMTLETLRAVLSSVDKFDDLIVMPFLNGVEVSIDSLMTSKGFVGVARYKVGGRCTKIDGNSHLIEISKKFAEITGITTPYNLQLRYHKDKLYLLEVNTRMSGGTFKSCLAGVNIPYLALCAALNIPFSLPTKLNTLLISEIETPIILESEE